MNHDIDTVIVGAGVVGLAIARSLTRRGSEVVVLERNTRIGAEVSSRSSEVIHAGLYYTPESLKARFSVQGRKLLYALAAEAGVPVRRTGKLVVATSPEEIGTVASIATTAHANGVEGVRILNRDEARAMERALECHGALLSPETGTIDTAGLVAAIEGEAASRGGTVVLATTVTGLAALSGGGFAVESVSDGATSRVTCRKLVLSGGLGATDLGTMLAYPQGYRVPVTYFAKGHYFSILARVPFSRLVYPVPTGGGLGVHLTIAGGRARLGPDIGWIDQIDYAFDDPDGARGRAFLAAARKFWPGLPDDALQPDSTGIRPKLTRAGEPAADFAIHGPREHGQDGLVALYGIESPGITSSLAIGEHVAGLLQPLS